MAETGKRTTYISNRQAVSARHGRTVTERFCHNVRICYDGCWYWMVSLDHWGYGIMSGVFGKKSAKAHRVSYELFVGPIPGRLPLDHICRNHRCVNPEHLQPVTQGENNRRAGERRTVCRNGHPWGDTLTVRRRNGKVERWCKLCNDDRNRRSKARRQALLA